MKAPSRHEMPQSVENDEHRLIAESGLFDEEFYRSQVAIPFEQSAIDHYLSSGCEEAAPSRIFDGVFLKPYYEFGGLRGSAFFSWLILRAVDENVPGNSEAAAARAHVISQSPYFDSVWYGADLPPGLDPAILYALVGEPLGHRPSPNFDPLYYVERYPDLKIPGLRLLDHFSHHGASEGRRGTSVADGLVLAEDWEPTDSVLVIAHEASRTGAPLLALALVRELTQLHTVVSVVLRGGELMDAFTDASRALVGPFEYQDYVQTEMRRVAERIVKQYRPRYAIANSIETSVLVPHLAAMGVPVIALVHEFASYTRPVSKLHDMFHWAAHVVFPARIVAESAYAVMPQLRSRGNIHVIAQGRVNLPSVVSKAITGKEKTLDADQLPDGFVILGAGHVQMRKGVDIFVSTAAAVRRLAPDLHVSFVWVGGGYDPEEDMGYSVYLSEQIARSGLSDTVIFLPPTDEIDKYYSRANTFFMCSRLDPQPNVGIDVMLKGVPLVAFDGASGTAEVLLSDETACELVVPHLDVQAAAQVFCRLAGDRTWYDRMSEAVAALAARTYRMSTYVEQIDRFGVEAARLTGGADLDALIHDEFLDADLIAFPAAPIADPLELANVVMQQWAANGLVLDPSNPFFRRPTAGFHPQVYAAAHADECLKEGRNPYVHWRQNGQLHGAWSREVLVPSAKPSATRLRLALHAHFHYLDHAWDLAYRLSLNSSSVDLYITTDIQSKAKELDLVFRSHRGDVRIIVLPNRGRDIAPFIHVLSELEGHNYELVGHVHGKKSSTTDEVMGAEWCRFLFENLIGGATPAMDAIANALESRPNVGLIMAEDPHIVGWNKNKSIAADLASAMGIAPVNVELPDFFDFPLGTMFWARPSAINRLTSVALDYPVEPVADDGTILHALERLIPFIVRAAGFDVLGVRVPGTTW
ncbi:rhamnan synthesis F family protein [Methylobacterium iners]|uniref:D-inositol-3-phosphate glycosyltransferase n=1 Tax=Methylobacterium iners TaxID=418707 RepID=A0ABQ4S395_9HYPH|nr:rhamnan synthesis F family protein [Methylobacterium iners]GJD96647.1 D-inositol-3-phosphate glycosyltransferase [Methylobacterium iners]